MFKLCRREIAWEIVAAIAIAAVVLLALISLGCEPAPVPAAVAAPVVAPEPCAAAITEWATAKNERDRISDENYSRLIKAYRRAWDAEVAMKACAGIR